MQAHMWVWKMADHELKKLVTERVTIKFWGGLLNRLEQSLKLNIETNYLA